MRKYQVILLLALTACTSERISQVDYETFSNIEIDFMTGDERIVFHSMTIFKDDGKIIAHKTSPFYYYGISTDSLWATELKGTDLRLLKDFLSTAESLNDTCSMNSTSIDSYSIRTTEKDLKIVGNCNWFGIDYDSLERKIFQAHYSELTEKRELLADSLWKSFTGTWDVSGWNNGVLKHSNIVLTRTSTDEPKEDGRYRWTFSNEDELSFKNHLGVTGGTSTVGIVGATYRVLAVRTNEIELEFLW